MASISRLLFIIILLFPVIPLHAQPASDATDECRTSNRVVQLSVSEIAPPRDGSANDTEPSPPEMWKGWLLFKLKNLSQAKTHRCNSGILRVPLEDTGFWSWARPSKALSLTVNGAQYWRRAVQIRPCSSCRRYLTSSALPNSAPPRPATPAHHTGYYPRGSHAPSSTPGSSHHALHYLNLLPSFLCCGAVRITTRRRATDLCTIIMAPVFVCARSRPNEMYQLNATAQYAESR